MIKVDLETLQKYLLQWGYEVQLQKETKQLYLIFSLDGKDFPLFLRIFDQSDLLQLLVFMPSKIKLGTEPDLARLLHLINKEMDIPGFGMDEGNKLVFYRAMLPIPGKKIDSNVLESYVKSLRTICETISQPVLAVATGQATYTDIIRIRNESENIHQTRVKP